MYIAMMQETNNYFNGLCFQTYICVCTQIQHLYISDAVKCHHTYPVPCIQDIWYIKEHEILD